MGLKAKLRKVGAKVKKRYKERELRAAKRKGMTLSEYKAHKERLRKKEVQERTADEEWKIERKYKAKRKAVKEGQPESDILRRIAQIGKNVRENLLAEQGKQKKKQPFAFKQPDYNKVVIELVQGKKAPTKKRKSKKKKKKSRR